MISIPISVLEFVSDAIEYLQNIYKLMGGYVNEMLPMNLSTSIRQEQGIANKDDDLASGTRPPYSSFIIQAQSFRGPSHLFFLSGPSLLDSALSL